MRLFVTLLLILFSTSTFSVINPTGKSWGQADMEKCQYDNTYSTNCPDPNLTITNITHPILRDNNETLTYQEIQRYRICVVSNGSAIPTGDGDCIRTLNIIKQFPYGINVGTGNICIHAKTIDTDNVEGDYGASIHCGTF